MKKSTETTTHKQKGPWKKGQSGNPAGRPKGARHKATMAALALLEGEALTRKVIEEAIGGNMVALKLCLERLVPPAKERPVDIFYPKVSDAHRNTLELSEIESRLRKIEEYTNAKKH